MHAFVMGRRNSLGIAALCAFLGLAGGSAQAEPAVARKHKPKPELSATDLATRIHALVNAERERQKLPALAWDGKLSQIAAKHSQDMARRDYLAHDSPEGRGYLDRYREDGYVCRTRIGNTVLLGAENIALGRRYNTLTRAHGVTYYDWNSASQVAERAVAGWMNSPSHRENILTPQFKREGIGVEIHRDNKIYITQNFC